MYVHDHHTLDELQDLAKPIPRKRIWIRFQAVILALQDLGRDRRGHYGVGEGATAQLPGTGGN